MGSRYKDFTLWFIAIVIIVGPIGQFLIFRYTPVYDLNLLTSLYDDASWVKGRPKIAIMGSSHARYHIIPDEIAKLNPSYSFEDIVNIGENAASSFEMYTAFMKNREKFSDLETVYYTLEPHMSGEKYYLYNTYEKILLDYEQWEYLEKHQKKQNSFFFPLQIFADSLKFETSDRSKTNGYSSLRHKKFNTFSKGKVVRLVCEPLELFPVSSHGVKYLKRLKDELEGQGTRLIFVLTPTYTWQKYYAEEGKPFDDMLISMLDEALGESVVIGSFWPEDFDLLYQDFKDDTHMADTGAKKFNRALFHNIKSHRDLAGERLKNTFLYRFEKPEKPELRPLHILELERLDWQYDTTADLVRADGGIRFSESDVEKHSLLYAKFSEINDTKSVTIDMTMPDENLRMISITLKSAKEYGHFFLDPSDLDAGRVTLSIVDVSRYSKGFDIGKVDQLAIRLYPKEGTSINDFRLNAVEFLH